MAGIGIRYLELARRLPRHGVDVVLVSPAEPEETAALADRRGRGAPLRARRPAPRILADCDAAVAQGQLANDLVLEMPDLPVAIDLYDPWLIENFAYLETLGLDPYRNDHATWVLQMSRGDFFLCSSEEQRTFYLGFLAALGRVNPERLAGDPDLATLIAPVPFGVPGRAAAASAAARRRARPGERRLLFGGLYDWYDPWTLLDALARLDRPLDPAAHPQPQPGEHAAAPVRRGRGALPLARLVGEPRRRSSTGCRPSGATTCCATSTSWSRRTGRAWRRASRCAPASSTPSPPAARW